MDLVSFVEFQNALKAVQKTQASALMAIRQFWGELLSSGESLVHACTSKPSLNMNRSRERDELCASLRADSVTLTQLSGTLRSLSALESKAHRLYRIMLERYHDNVSLLRLYATFLTGVKGAPGKALRMFAKADSLEDAQAETKQGNLVTGGKPGSRRA